MSEQEAIELVCTRMRETFDVRQIMLFGSHARGEAKADSDLDMIVIVVSDLPFIPRQAAALQALSGRDFALDLLVYTPDEFEQAVGMTGSAAYWAQQEGKIVFAA